MQTERGTRRRMRRSILQRIVAAHPELQYSTAAPEHAIPYSQIEATLRGHDKYYAVPRAKWQALVAKKLA